MLQDRIYSLEYTPREVRTTEGILDKLYDGAYLGLRNESLAYYAGLTPSEYRQLEQLDPRIEHAIVAGKTDSEAELSEVMLKAARNGDAKTALEILKHRHNWAATQVVKNEHTGANGGPIALAAVDLRSLNQEELQQMKQLMEKAAGSANG